MPETVGSRKLCAKLGNSLNFDPFRVLHLGGITAVTPHKSNLISHEFSKQIFRERGLVVRLKAISDSGLNVIRSNWPWHTRARLITRPQTRSKRIPVWHSFCNQTWAAPDSSFVASPG